MMNSFRTWALGAGLTVALLAAGCARHPAPQTAEGAGSTNQPTASGNFPTPNYGEKSASLPQKSSHETASTEHGGATQETPAAHADPEHAPKSN